MSKRLPVRRVRCNVPIGMQMRQAEVLMITLKLTVQCFQVTSFPRQKEADHLWRTCLRHSLWFEDLRKEAVCQACPVSPTGRQEQSREVCQHKCMIAKCKFEMTIRIKRPVGFIDPEHTYKCRYKTPCGMITGCVIE